MNTPPPKVPVHDKLSTAAKVLACVVLGVVLTGVAVLLARYFPLN